MVITGISISGNIKMNLMKMLFIVALVAASVLVYELKFSSTKSVTDTKNLNKDIGNSSLVKVSDRKIIPQQRKDHSLEVNKNTSTKVPAENILTSESKENIPNSSVPKKAPLQSASDSIFYSERFKIEEDDNDWRPFAEDAINFQLYDKSLLINSVSGNVRCKASVCQMKATFNNRKDSLQLV